MFCSVVLQTAHHLVLGRQSSIYRKLSVLLSVEFRQEGSPTKIWVSRSRGLPRSTLTISSETSSLWHFQGYSAISKGRRLFSCRQPIKAALAYDFARHEHYGHLSTVRAWTFLYRFKICSDYPNVKNMNYYITTDCNLQAPFFSSAINHKACCQKRVFLSWTAVLKYQNSLC